MKITIVSTDKIVQLNEVPARLWTGETESGIPVHCYVTRISPQTDDPAAAMQFRAELIETAAPTPDVGAIPLRMIL